jgi:hypothetical protein
MKLLSKTIVLAFLSLNGILLTGKMTHAQETAIFNENSRITVSITSNSSELTKDSPFLIVVRIYNKSDKKFPLVYFPALVLEREGLNSNDKGKFGNSFTGEIKFDSESEFMKKDFLEVGERLEFEVDLTKLGWQSKIQSVDLPNNISNLPKGNYLLYSEILFNASEKGKRFVKHVPSNMITISFK